MRLIWLIPLAPVSMHLLVLLGAAQWAIFPLFLIFSLLLLGSGRTSLPRWMAVSVLWLLAGFLWWQGETDWALFALPLIIYGMLLWVFAESLRAGSTPVATRFARLLRGEELPPEVVGYTRNVTRFWVGYFLLVWLLMLGLALWAPLSVWSWVANLGGYVLTGGLFVLEFLFRRWHLRHLSHPGLVDYLLKLSRCDLRATLRR